MASASHFFFWRHVVFRWKGPTIPGVLDQKRLGLDIVVLRWWWCHRKRAIRVLGDMKGIPYAITSQLKMKLLFLIFLLVSKFFVQSESLLLMMVIDPPSTSTNDNIVLRWIKQSSKSSPISTILPLVYHCLPFVYHLVYHLFTIFPDIYYHHPSIIIPQSSPSVYHSQSWVVSGCL